MRDVTRREAFGVAAGTAALVWGGAAGATSADVDGPPVVPADHRLWYRSPAEEMRQALVIGNGRLGAMISGQVREEIIPLNEDSLWCGQPHDWQVLDGRATLKEIRQAVFAGEYARADSLCKQLQGPFSHSYAPLAQLRLSFDHGPAISDYQRALDLDAATATVKYRADGIGFTREMFASHPAQLILLRLRPDRPGALHCRIGLDSLIRHAVRPDANGLTLTGKAPTRCVPNYQNVTDPIVYSDVPGRGMFFATRLEILSQVGGRCVAEGNVLRISAADELIVAISAATGFRGHDVAPDTPSAEVEAQAVRPIAAARGAPYQALLAAHLADHRALYRRMSLRLGTSSGADQPTDRRLAANRKRPDPSLSALYCHFSRYLLIASSRPGTQAANLQGIWSWEMQPPWSCNYTTNINVQQNYWGAEVGNLAELHLPMMDLVEGLTRNGKKTARDLYGASGWCVHHNSDLWHLTSPVGEGDGGPTWANFALAGPWLVRHVWEHYLYSGDRTFLRQRAYPLLKGCAAFCADWLIEDPRSGYLTTAPSVSTENSFTGPDGGRHAVSAGCTMDIAMIREVFTATAAAATQLGVDADFAARLTALARRLPPYQIGRFGQLQEWEKDFVESEPEQRHISHLYPVTPGCEITPRRTPQLAKAAHVSMTRRLEASGAQTGWGRAWAIHVFARLGDAARAHENLNALLDLSTGDTLLDVLPSGSGPLFQIDGNFAGGATVLEMLMQSHDGAIAFLPALPAEWADGELRGVRARGGVTLDLTWKGGRMVSARLYPARDGEQVLRAPSGQRIARVTEGMKPVALARGESGSVITLRRGGVYDVAFL